MQYAGASRTHLDQIAATAADGLYYLLALLRRLHVMHGLCNVLAPLAHLYAIVSDMLPLPPQSAASSPG
jgi:hypothetical protein